MQATLQQIQSINPQEIGQKTTAPCNKCGEPTENDVAGQKLVGNRTCAKCMHGYFCYLFCHELRKAGYQKKEREIDVATYQLKQISESFTSRYGKDWRDQMRVALPNFEFLLVSELRTPVVIYSLIEEAKQKGFIHSK